MAQEQAQAPDAGQVLRQEAQQVPAGAGEEPREERVPGRGPAASRRRRRLRLPWRESNPRCASTIRWCRSSKRCRQQHASCRCSWLGQTRPWAWQAQPMRKASPPCSVSSCFSSRGMPQLPAKRSNRKPIVLGKTQQHGGCLPRPIHCAIGGLHKNPIPPLVCAPLEGLLRSCYTPSPHRIGVALPQPGRDCFAGLVHPQTVYRSRPGWPA